MVFVCVDFYFYVNAGHYCNFAWLFQQNGKEYSDITKNLPSLSSHYSIEWKKM